MKGGWTISEIEAEQTRLDERWQHIDAMICPECDGELEWIRETASGHENDPNDSGYELLWCYYCDKEFDRKWGGRG